MQLNNPLASREYLERIDHRDEDVRGPYFRDQTAIIHSMPFRRLKHKAQVFFSPKNDHICTRIARDSGDSIPIC
jgi:dGTPase